MNLLVYILVYPLIWLLSILPFRILYLISDGVYFLLYYIIGYRKKVVYDNLKLAFPNKAEKEILAIRKKFYHHFVDVFIEMIKLFTISKNELDKRYKYLNSDLLNELSKDGKSIIIISSHYANWEWEVGMDSFINYNCNAAFTKISNKYFNKRILSSRQRFGVTLIEAPKITRTIIKNKDNNIQSVYGLLSDQSPQIQKTHYWSEFLGVKVPVITGTETLAKKYDMNIVFIKTKKIKRGYYESSFSLITDDAKKYADYEITDIYLRKLEAQIYEEPAYYFWTHKRFKHKDKAPK
jgi:KDO2-lipid IV(A) lauroyltransferase